MKTRTAQRNTLANSLAELGESVSARLARFFERAILEGEYPPGHRLHEIELAKRLGVSRTPLREAFHVLEKKGLLSIVPRRGVFVKEITLTEMEWLLTIRIALDGLAARLAAANATDGQIKELKRLIDRQQAALKKKDLPEFREVGQAFHHLVYKATGNLRLVSIYNTLRTEGALFPFWDLRHPGELDVSMAEHRRVADAVAARDPQTAQIEAERHISRIRDRVLAASKEEKQENNL